MSTGSPTVLETPRLDLVPAPMALIEAVLAGDSAAAGVILGAILAADVWLANPAVPAGWPIHLRALRADPAELAWRIRLIVLREERRAIGSVTLKGPPQADGTVDLG